MNSFVLMAEILTEPELRRTPDNQSAIASFLVQFPSQRPEDPANRLKVSGWNNLAEQIIEQYHKGDQVVIEGRLQVNTVDRNGYKEKLAELTAQRIHPLGQTLGQPPAKNPGQSQFTAKAASVPAAVELPKADTETNFDNIPF
jgi:single-strand DNA-binding protein